jgi:hypothetical protein
VFLFCESNFQVCTIVQETKITNNRCIWEIMKAKEKKKKKKNAVS